MIFSALVTFVAAILAVNGDIYPPQHGHRVVCYMGNADYDNAKFNASEAEPALHLCTHLIFSCGYLRDLQILLYAGGGYDALENFKNLVAMKFQNFPHLKIILGLGFIDFTTTPYLEMAETPEKRAAFIQNTLKFLQDNNLDGMDIGWKFAFFVKDFTNNNINQVFLVKELRQQFDKHGLILSMAIFTGVDGRGGALGVDTPGLAEHVHFLNIGSQVHKGFHSGVERHMGLGVPAEKINMVVFSMGAFYTQENQHPIKNRNKIAEEVIFTQLKGYSVMCKEMEDGGWTKEVNKDTGLVSFGNKDFLVFMDNPYSTTLKISYAMKNHLGGIAFRSLAGDDHKGECVGSDGKYPMLRDIDRRLVELAPGAYKDIFDELEQNDASYFWNAMKNSRTISTKEVK